MPMPLLSICIPTYNRAEWLKACLQACVPQVEALPRGLVEVVVSDNHSPDGTPEVLAEWAERHACLVVHRNEANNYAANFDTVLEHAQGTYAWLMGDDDALLPGAVAHMVRLIQEAPRDFYLPHVVMDSQDPAVNRLAWFRRIPRLDWNLSDPGEFLEYMDCGCNGSVVFTFMSVLIFRREPWLEAARRRDPAITLSGWPQVATALDYIRDHGLLRIVPEALVNYHCSTGAWGEGVWDRAMQDLRGLLRIADAFFPGQPELHRAFMGNLRRNHGDAWITHHRLSAPDEAGWRESRELLLRAGFDPLKVAAVDLGERLINQKEGPGATLDPGSLMIADRGFLVRGARKVLVMVGMEALPDLGLLLAALRHHTLAEVLVLGPEGSGAEALEPDEALGGMGLDLARFTGEPAYQNEVCDALREFAPDLVLNADPVRHPAWDILAGTLGAPLSLAFPAPPRKVDPKVAVLLDQPYRMILPQGTVAALLDALDVRAGAPPA